jgi:5'-nucleotidase
MSGKTFKEALENGVSKWPGFDGRWPCVSGIKFKFDPERPAFDRI